MIDDLDYNLNISNDNCKVSVIIPSYNRSNLLEKTISSILNQNCNFKFEIIIGDDCSDEQTIKVLHHFENDFQDIIKIIYHETNVGLASNWATCVKASCGKYICNCDNDDYWHNQNKLQLQYDFMEKNPDYGVCHTDYRTINRETGKLINYSCYDCADDKDLQKTIMSGKFIACNATMMYRSDILKKYIKLDDYIDCQFTLQDWNTWMILAAYTKFYSMHISTATFGIETVSITRPDNLDRFQIRLEKEKQCYKYICNLFPEKYPFREEEYDEYINLKLLKFSIKIGDYNNSKVYLRKMKNPEIKHELILYSKILFLLFHNISKLRR